MDQIDAEASWSGGRLAATDASASVQVDRLNVAELDDATIKSARRTLQVFEFFAALQRPATVTEVYTALGLPQSSVSKLLRSFVRLGYLDYDPQSRTYFPTLRIMVLSDWLHDRWFTNKGIAHAMEGLRNRLGTSAILGVQNDKHVLYVLALRPLLMPCSAIPMGTLRPICLAGVGKALLMTKPDKEIAMLVRRINAEEEVPSKRVDCNSLLDDIRESRRRGYALSNGACTPGVSVAAIPLPVLPGHPQMALGVGASDPWMREHLYECVGALRELSRSAIKPVSGVKARQEMLARDAAEAARIE